MNPSIWGKYFWTTLHLVALGYDDKPTLEMRKNYEDFFLNFYKVIPCKKCAINYKRHLSELPIYPYLDSKQNLFKWTVLLHNIVNRELGKQQWNLEYAYVYYTSTQSFLNVDHTINENQNLNNKKSKSSIEMQYIMIGVNIIICVVILHFIMKT